MNRNIFIFIFLVIKLQGGICQTENVNWCQETGNSFSLKLPLSGWTCDTPFVNQYPCACPAVRYSFIPDSFTPIRYLNLLVVVVDSGIYGVTQENIDTMMAEVNEYFEPWKIHFCYSTEFIESSQLSNYPKNKDSIINVIIQDCPNLGLVRK